MKRRGDKIRERSRIQRRIKEEGERECAEDRKSDR
jgi:hypothetical protein